MYERNLLSKAKENPDKSYDGTNCLEYTGRRADGGYGIVSISVRKVIDYTDTIVYGESRPRGRLRYLPSSVNIAASRMALCLFSELDPKWVYEEGFSFIQAMHLCNNPPCFNPFHLKFGTARENQEYRWKCKRGEVIV